jgi:hypothetical protein
VTAALGIAIGGVWELFEWASDYVLGIGPARAGREPLEEHGMPSAGQLVAVVGRIGRISTRAPSASVAIRRR